MLVAADELLENLLRMAGNRLEGLHFYVVPDLPRPVMLDNLNAVYLFLPAGETRQLEIMLDSPAYTSLHPSFPQDEGFDVFAVARSHAFRARTVLLALLNNEAHAVDQ